jgi:hypothetical protein
MWHNFRRFLPSGETGLPTLRDCVAAHVRQGAYRGDFSPTKLLDVRGIDSTWIVRFTAILILLHLHNPRYGPFDSVKGKEPAERGLERLNFCLKVLTFISASSIVDC